MVKLFPHESYFNILSWFALYHISCHIQDNQKSVIYWWFYVCFLKWNIVNRRLGSLPLSENGVLPIHVPEHSHSHLLNGDADQNKGTSRLKRSLAIEEGMAGISYPIILYIAALTRCWDPPYCLHFISHGPQLSKNSHSLVRCPSMSRWLDLRGSSNLIQYVYRIDWYRHSVGYLLHLERRIRAFTTGVPGQLLTALHWWILVPQNCYLWTLQVKSSCRDISKT